MVLVLVSLPVMAQRDLLRHRTLVVALLAMSLVLDATCLIHLQVAPSALSTDSLRPMQSTVWPPALVPALPARPDFPALTLTSPPPKLLKPRQSATRTVMQPVLLAEVLQIPLVPNVLSANMPQLGLQLQRPQPVLRRAMLAPPEMSLLLL